VKSFGDDADGSAMAFVDGDANCAVQVAFTGDDTNGAVAFAGNDSYMPASAISLDITAVFIKTLSGIFCAFASHATTRWI
jgi:hypothetical protein